MSVIHRTTLTPTKPELLAAWLPGRPWYPGTAGAPRPEKAGGFRLEDPDGQVGIEFMVITEPGSGVPGLLAPMTYRGAPLAGAEHALIGTLEHGVLGKRWVYDACHDPLAVAETLALIGGRVKAHAQSVNDAFDETVVVDGGSPVPTALAPVEVVDDGTGTSVLLSGGFSLRFRRVLDPAEAAGEGVAATVTAPWTLPDGTSTRAVLLELRAPGTP